MGGVLNRSGEQFFKQSGFGVSEWIHCFRAEEVGHGPQGIMGRIMELTTPENTITYHNALSCYPKNLHKHCLQFLVGS